VFQKDDRENENEKRIGLRRRIEERRK